MEKLTETQIQELRRQNEEKKEYLLSYKKYRQQADRLQEQLNELRYSSRLVLVYKCRQKKLNNWICYAIEPHFGGVRYKTLTMSEMRPQCLVNQGSFCPYCVT